MTPEVVVRSGVWCADIKGDKSHKLLVGVMEKVKQGSIRTPSTFRLLRLLNGIRCERGTECYAYDRKEEKSALIQGCLKEVRPFGLALCQKCFQYTTSQYFLSSLNGIDKKRIDQFRSHFLNLPEVIEKVTLERVGPIMAATTLKQIEVTYRTDEERSTAIDDIFREYDEQLTDDEKNSTASLIAVFDDEIHQQKEEAKRKSEARRNECIAKAEALKQRKRELSEPVMEMIEDLLGDYEHKRVFVFKCFV